MGAVRTSPPQMSSPPQPAPPMCLLFLPLSPHRRGAWWSALPASLKHPFHLLCQLPAPLSWPPCWSCCLQAQGPLCHLPQPPNQATTLLRNLAGSQTALSLGTWCAVERAQSSGQTWPTPCSAPGSGMLGQSLPPWSQFTASGNGHQGLLERITENRVYRQVGGGHDSWHVCEGMKSCDHLGRVELFSTCSERKGRPSTGPTEAADQCQCQHLPVPTPQSPSSPAEPQLPAPPGGGFRGRLGMSVWDSWQPSPLSLPHEPSPLPKPVLLPPLQVR